MSVKEIEAAIAQLPEHDLAELSTWFQQFHNDAWDKQMQRDSEAGRLDALFAEAEAEYKAGLSKPL